jgi:ABC-type glycerol-3-phosphate transport system substrate-binding protein
VLIDAQLPYDSYVSKGLFMDLMPYLSTDTELPESKFNAGFLNALKTEDGKLYSIASGFNVRSLVGKQSIFANEKPGVSFERLNEIAAEKNAVLFSPYTSRQTFMSEVLFSVIGNYVDRETGECYFNTPEFIALLEASKDYPEEINYDNMDWEAAQNGFKEDKILLSTAYIYDFRSRKNDELSEFGEATSFLGYPNSEGKTGITANTSGEVAIMAKTRNPDGAWAFLKDFLLYKDPNGMPYSSAYGGLSAFQEDLNQMALEAKEDPYYIDYETKEKVHYDNTIYTETGEVTIPNNTDADNQRIFDLINGISGISRTEYALQEIIADDITAFFDGQKSAAETAAIIQDRASTYVAESR